MSPTTIFAVAYLAGTLVGLPSGAYLPWWLAGGPAWAMAIAAVVVRPFGPTDEQWRRAFDGHRPWLIGERIRRLDDLHALRVACLAHGLFWGGMSGAVATSMPAALDWLLWPGHAHDLNVVAAILVAFGWLVGAAPDVEDEPLRPFASGLFLYLVVMILCVVPAAWKVL